MLTQLMFLANTISKKAITTKSHQKKKKGYQFDTLYTVSVHSRRTKDNELPQTLHKTTQVVWTIRKTKESQFFIHILRLTTNQSNFHRPAAAAVDPEVSRRTGCCSGSRRSLSARGTALRAYQYIGPAEAAAVH